MTDPEEINNFMLSSRRAIIEEIKKNMHVIPQLPEEVVAEPAAEQDQPES